MVYSFCQAFISDTLIYKWQSSRNVTTNFETFVVKISKDKNTAHTSVYVEKIIFNIERIIADTIQCFQFLLHLNDFQN